LPEDNPTQTVSSRQSALQILRDVFGLQAFRQPQGEVIAALVAGENALVLMPTGGGKSLCYQIPALLRPGTAVVISPLIALMHDQVAALKKLGVRAGCINSAQSARQKEQVTKAMLAGDLDLLYISPERLMMPGMLEILGQTTLALFAIDEAHCVSQWGHDFREEYKQLGLLQELFADVPRIALTATADQRTRQEIITELGLQNAKHFISSFDRPNIHYTITRKGKSREKLLEFLNREHPNEGGIVYCLSRKRVEEIAEWLSVQGRMALPYHAGLQSEVRERHQAKFLQQKDLIMVATIAFGMGVDKRDVRFVAHVNLPKSVEAYTQETGRAGRDGKPANAWMHYTKADTRMQRYWLKHSEADKAHKRAGHHRLQNLLDLCETPTCRRKNLLKFLGETYPNPCGNCDICRAAPSKWDVIGQVRLAIMRLGSFVFRRVRHLGF